ncbi:hypothetical protein [Natroniella sp. ANB-PHB2]|uniref:hypothetical protein n=1 Tax=Natroniella sp. ANB-PHB2 TaxID=3384444 RepID=UPI0038D38661
MERVDLFIVFWLIYDLLKVTKNYHKLRKYGAKKIESFNCKSDMVFFVIFTFLNIALFFPFAEIINFILFQLLLLFEFIIKVRKIDIYQNGVFYQSKFTKWDEMGSIRELEKGRIQIEINNSFFGVLNIDKVERREEFLRLLYSKTELKAKTH